MRARFRGVALRDLLPEPVGAAHAEWSCLEVRELLVDAATGRRALALAAAPSAHGSALPDLGRPPAELARCLAERLGGAVDLSWAQSEWRDAVTAAAREVAAAGALIDREARQGEDGSWLVPLRNEAERELLERQRVRERLERELRKAGHPARVVFAVAAEDDAEAPPSEDDEAVVQQAAEILRRRREAAASQGEMVWGGPVEGQATPLVECVQEGARVVVEGRVFSVETAALRGGRSLALIHITDGTDSLAIKVFGESDEIEAVAGALSAGRWSVRVRGTLEQDARGHEVQLRAEGLVRLPYPERRDEAAEKRVELHVHTRMSAMDGLIDVDALFARAAAWGHRAVGITDHGVVQAFPEAAQAARRHGVKALYGMEAYVVDDRPPVVIRPDASPLADTPFVALDLETTGLSPRGHEIIEIGAVRFEGGEPVARFQTFVDPGRELPAETRELTGITPDMLRGAPPPADALAAFLEFAGDAPLVAHNAAFDAGFLHRKALAHLARHYAPAVVDTMWLARALLPELSGHGLAAVAPVLGVPLPRHHRALQDAEAAGGVFLRLLDRAASDPSGEGAPATLEALQRLAARVPSRLGRPFHVTLFARDEEGLRNLYRLVTESHLKHFHRVPRIPRGLLAERREGLLVGGGCADSEVVDAWLAGEPDGEWRARLSFYDFLEIVPRDALAHLVPSALASDEDIRALQRAVADAGLALGRPVVAVGDAHYLDPEEAPFREVLRVNQRGGDERSAALHLRTTDEMLAEFGHLGAERAKEVVIAAPGRLVDAVEDLEPLPDGLFAPIIPGAAEEVAETAWARARAIYGDPLPPRVEERVAYELERIVGHGYAALYLIAARLVRRSVEDGYLVGSRGSVGSSLVATLLGVTEVNPLPPHYVCGDCRWVEFAADVADPGLAEIRSGFDLPERDCPKCGRPLKGDGHDIPFASFMGFEGDKVPDIDLNFSGEYQARAHQAAEEILGRGSVFRAGTIATVAERTAFGLAKAYAEATGRPRRPAELRRLALGCAGVKRTTGQHPGGLMVVPEGVDVHAFTPLQRPANDDGAEQVTTHFDYHSIEGRLVKLDLLGHDDPTTLKILHALTGIDPLTIPFSDPVTRSLFSSAEALGPGVAGDDEVGTLGIPEFGTRFVRGMLMDTRPRTFAELTRISGLSHGTDVWANNARDLTRDGTATLSEVISTRDDLFLYLMERGMEPRRAFDIGERVRRGRGLTDEDEQAMLALGVPRWYVESCRKITYLFPKAHAVAYVMMAFRIAWYKAHRPAAFYAAYFTIRAADFDAAWVGGTADAWRARARELERPGAPAKERAQAAMLEVAAEMAARGLRFLPVDLERSDAVAFRVEPAEAARREDAAGAGLRVPFLAVPGLGEKAARTIAQAREAGPFRSRADFRERTGVSRAVIEVLNAQGALAGLPEDDQIALF